MDAGRDDFLRQLHAAYAAINRAGTHRLAGPGYKGLAEELLTLAEVTDSEVILAAYPGWPNLDAMERAEDTAAGHLRRLLAAGCRSFDSVEDVVCFYCGCVLQPEEPHKPGCPYIAARAFVDGLASAPGRSAAGPSA